MLLRRLKNVLPDEKVTIVSIQFNSIQFNSILFYSILFYSILFYSILFHPLGKVFGQCPANLRLELVNTSTECNEYALYLKDAPTISLYRLSASVYFSQNTAGTVQAQLGASLAAAGGYSFTVNNNGAPRVNINRIGSGGNQPPFTLPPSPNNELLLFTFSFAGPPGATVTAYIGSDPMIFLNTGQFPGTICSIGISNQMANPVSCTLDPGSEITGRIVSSSQSCDEGNGGVPNIQVTVSSTSLLGLSPCVDYSDNFGQYDCIVLPNEDYSIVPYAGNYVPDCGLSNEDINKINQHLLGITFLTTPREYIAADFNFSNSITTSDQVAIRRVLLYNQFSPNFISWRFLSNYASIVVTPPSFNWSLVQESIQLSNVPSGPLPPGIDTEFTAVKIGDVVPNCQVCPTQLTAIEPSFQYAALNIDAFTAANSVIELILTPEGNVPDQTVHGLEFQLAPEYLQLLEVSGMGKFTLLGENHVTDTENNYFRAVWLPFEAGQSDQKAQLRIKARLLKTFQTPEQLIYMMENSQYFQDDQEIRWKFNFPNEQNRGYFYPNPFQNQLEFTAPNTASTLRVLDSRGAMIWQSDLLPGQRMDIPTDNWPAGAYFYHCIANEHSHSGKLIKQ